jgi:hypothetical protein
MDLEGQSDLTRHYCYRVFGLAVRSVFKLPEAEVPIDESVALTSLDLVEIVRGPVPQFLQDGRKLTDWMEVGKDACLYNFEGVCRMLVLGGRTITVEVNANVPESDVRPFLLGAALGAVAHQRRLMPLHISAVLTPWGPFAFTGPSGAGKSTMAAALQKFNGWPIICDDVAVIKPQEEPLFIHVGIRRQKLWIDAIAGLDLSHRRMERDFSRVEKFHLEFESKAGALSQPIVSLFEMAWGEVTEISELSPAGRYRVIQSAIYRPYLVPLLGDASEIHRTSVSLAGAIRVFRFKRPRDFNRLREVAATIARRFETSH